MGIVLAIIVFSVIVIVHEFGHFLMAKLNGIEVFEFSLGMGPTLISKRIGDTLYCLKLLPLGGSCMMGEDGFEEESEEAFEGANLDSEGSDEAASRQPIIRGNFNEKSVWARILVIAGGPLFNFILAWFFAVIMILWIGFDAPIIGEVVENSGAMEAGLEAGDQITELNGRNIYLWREISSHNMFHSGETVVVEYIRDGVAYETILEPQMDEAQGTTVMGVISTSYQEATFLEALENGIYTVRYWILTVIDSLKMMLKGEVALSDISGPVGIVDIVDETYEVSVQIGWDVVILNLLNLTTLLSANLGVMNLLPIPALDGGRLVFLIAESIRGKRISPEKEGMFHLVGFGALMLLMVVVLFNDLSHLFL
ncbi:MAG: RIP metalloprotease RseP [Eubacteriales bacterium]